MANRYDPLRQTEHQVEEEQRKGSPARGDSPVERGDAPAERAGAEPAQAKEPTPPAKSEKQEELDPVDAYSQALPGRVANLEARGYRRNGEIQNIINREDAGTIPMTSDGKKEPEPPKAIQQEAPKERAPEPAPQVEDARQQKALEMMEAIKAQKEREQAREQGRGEMER